MTDGNDPIFTAEASDGPARAGSVRTDRGTFATPTFMAVGTLGGVKMLAPAQVAEAGISVVLGNTYHLVLRPGPATVAALGGLGDMTGWSGPTLTDSGGYQAFSLAHKVHLTEDGVSFASHYDGRRVMLTPESSIEAQRQIGADIVMQFDDVPMLPSPPERVREATARSARWAARCRDAFTGTAAHERRQLLFGIQQGGLDAAQRAWSADALRELDPDGCAVGGLSVGESTAEMHAAFDAFVPMLPEHKPRYVMGIGYPADMLAAVAAGADMMDCVLPTRIARHGTALTSVGRLNLRNRRHHGDPRPLDPRCQCVVCRTFSRGYLRHLVTSGELLGLALVSLHNLSYYASLMRGAREAILEGRFAAYHRRCHEEWAAGDVPELPQRPEPGAF